MSASFEVTNNDVGRSLLQFLGRQMDESGKQIKRAIDSAACLINGRIQRFGSYRVRLGDEVVIYLDRFEKRKKVTMDVLYEDEHFRAVDKPPGFVCSGSDRLHRLDKETSGVLLESEDPKCFELFRNRKIEKEYLGVVEGKLPKSGRIENYLGVVNRRPGQKIIGECEDGKIAITEWDVIDDRNGLSLVLCKPITGRTHQIRVHLSMSGAPVVGDYVYGKRYSIRPSRMLLHAKKVSFIHPYTKESVVIDAPIPREISRLFT